MGGNGIDTNAAIAEIRTRLKLVNQLHTFVAFVLFAVIVGFLFEPVSGLLDFLPKMSLNIIVLIALVLMLAGSYMTRMLNRHIYRTVTDFNAKLEAVLHASKEITEEMHGDLLFAKIIDFSLLLTGSEAGSVLTLEGDNLVYSVAKGEGIPDVTGWSIPLSEGLPGWVAEQATPLYIEDMSRSAGFYSSLDWVAEYKTRNALCVPLVTRNGVVGVVELLNKREGTYDEKDLDVAQYMAGQAAASIERSRKAEDDHNYQVHMTDILVDAIDYLVPSRKNHSREVARYTNILSRGLDLTDEEQRQLHFAALLHDIGYIRAVPAAGPGEAELDSHSRFGHDILKEINLYRDIAPVVLHHHERFDGTGYPDRLSGADIPLGSRIIAVAQAFYEASELGGNKDERFSALRQRGEAELDPYLVDSFISFARDSID
jgi:putative methionine-R-sulfoxide reductase with GAF domain